MGKYSHPPVCGSINREPMTDTYRVLRVDNNGYVYVTAAAAALSAVIYGLDGGGTPYAYRNYNWLPSTIGAGGTGTVTAVSASFGPMTAGKHYQFWSSVPAWILAGGVAVTAAANDMPIQANAVYTYLPTAGYLYIALIRITMDGNYYFGQMEP